MSEFIDFTTSYIPMHSIMSRGNPVHNGKLPTRYREVRGVRVDGETIEFTNPTIPDRLHRSLVDGRYLRPVGTFKCVAFVALMHGLKPRGPITGDDDASFVIERTEVQVGPLDRPNTPIDLAMELPDGESLSYEHIIYPAHTTENPLYLHKLGAGRVCLSGLQDALTMYCATLAHPVSSFEVL